MMCFPTECKKLLVAQSNAEALGSTKPSSISYLGHLSQLISSPTLLILSVSMISELHGDER